MGGSMGGMHPMGMAHMGHMGMHPMGGEQRGNIHIFRQGAGPFFHQQQEKPQSISVTINVNTETVLHGAKLPIDVERWVMEGQNRVFESITLYVDVIQGIDNNEVIILKDQGNIVSDSCKGDIKVHVKIEPSTLYERRGLDIYYKKEISLLESLCGFTYDLQYVNGKSYTINNQAGKVIPPGYHKVIGNMGLTREGHTGNMVIVFHVRFPESISLANVAALTTILHDAK